MACIFFNLHEINKTFYLASDIARDEMLKPVVITLTESDEGTDTQMSSSMT